MNLQIKAIRVRLGLAQKDAAKLTNMPVRRYGSYERGERNLTLEDACVIADAFHCSLDELAGRWEYVGTHADDRQRRLNEDFASMDEATKEAAAAAVAGMAAACAQEEDPGEEPPGSDSDSRRAG